MATEAKNPVQTTEKSLRLIEFLMPKRSARIRDIVSELDMPKSTIHHHLNTLRKNGYVVKEGRRYRLSLEFLSIGRQIRKHLPIYRAGRQKVDELAEETGELVNIMAEERGKGVHIYQNQGEKGINLESHIAHIGMQMPLHATALGKSILAYLDEERVDEIIDQHGMQKITENTIQDRDLLDEELHRIRDRGFAVANEEREKGLHCVAAPILEPNGVLGAISISAPTSRIEGEYNEMYRESVQSAATMIQLQMKYADST